jgi:ABC-type transporter Mla MlaB component
MEAMLRITSETTNNGIRLKLEGTLEGLWVPELLNVWREAKCSAQGRGVSIDLTSVHRIDRAGEYLLALIRRCGSQLVGSGVLMTELIESIERDWAAGKEEVSHVQ